MAEGNTLADEFVNMRSITTILPILQCLVQCTDIFSAKALHYQHHHILFLHRNAIVHRMHRMIYGSHLLLTAKVCWHHKHRLTDGTIHREGRIQHQCSLRRTIYILVGIRDSDGAHSSRKASSDTCHHKGCYCY